MEKTINHEQTWEQDDLDIEAQDTGESSSAADARTKSVSPIDFNKMEGEEVEELRDEYTKHFDLGERRYQAVVFPEPVHYRDEASGKWEEIDNNFEEAEKDGRRVLINRSNALKVELATEINQEALVKLTDRGHTLSWSFEAASEKGVFAALKTGEQLKREALTEKLRAARKSQKVLDHMTLKEMEQYETAEERRIDTTEKSSEVEYTDILPGVTVRYALEGARIKEDIVVADEAAFARTAIKLPPEYMYRVTEHGGVDVLDSVSGEKCFEFETPYLIDARGEAGPCSVELEQMDGYVRMSYLPDAEYLLTAEYPVTIDPIVKSVGTSENMEAFCVKTTGMGDQRTKSLYNSGYLRIGKNGASRYTTVMRFNALTQIKASDTIISAKLRIATPNVKRMKNKYVGLYEVTSEWDATEASKTGVRVANKVMDYAVGASAMSFNLTNLYRQWYRADNSGVGKNNGIAFRFMSTNSKGFASIYKPTTGKKSNRPTITVNYVSHAGLDERWTYESQSAGRAGTTYVDLFNGNVVHEHVDTTMSGSRLPVSISHYYNSCLCNKNDLRCGYGWRHSGLQYVEERKVNSTQYYVWVEGDGTEHWFKKPKSNDTDIPIKDEETKQYTLTKKGPKEVDGRRRPARITIEDKGNTVMSFISRPMPPKKRRARDPRWEKRWLTFIEDSTEKRNTVEFFYAMPEGNYDDFDQDDLRRLEGKLMKIKDAAGRETNFVYDDSDMLTQIITKDFKRPNESRPDKTVTFAYSSNRLMSINYSELESEVTGKHTEFEYYTYETSEGATRSKRLLKSVKNYDDMRVTVDYEACVIGADTKDINEWVDPDEDDANDASKQYVDPKTDYALSRASSIETSKGAPGAGGTTYGAKLVFDYQNAQTQVTVVEAASNTAKSGKKISYQFDDKGQVTGVRDELGFAQFASYSGKFDGVITGMSKLQRPVINRIRDISLSQVDAVATAWNDSEHGSNWVPIAGAGNTAEEVTQAAEQCMGLNVMKLVRTTGTGELFFRKKVRVEGGKTYTLSSYVKVGNVGTGTNGAYMRIGPNADGSLNTTVSRGYSKYTSEGLDLGLPTDGWDRQTVTYKVSGSEGTRRDLYVDFVLGGEKGRARFACPQLEEGEVANSVNLLSNGDFFLRLSSDLTQPADWSPGSTVDMTNPHWHSKEEDPNFPSELSGGYVEIKDKPRKAKCDTSFVQTINIRGQKNDVYYVGGWAQGEAMPGSTSGTRGFRLTVQFWDAKAKAWKEVKGQKERKHFSSEWVGWQATGGAVTAPVNYTKMRVACVNKGQPNPSRFTNIYLFREQFGQTYSYDADGNLVDTTTLSGLKSHTDYDKENNLTTYVKPGRPKGNKKGYQYTLNYGTTSQKKQHLLRKLTTPEKQVTEYTYDVYGNVVGQKQSKGGSGAFIRTETEYDDRGNYAVKKTDARKNAVQMEIDTQTGLLWSVTDPKNTKVEYDYDRLRRLTEAKVELRDSNDTVTALYKNSYAYEDGRLKTVSHNTDTNADHDVKYTFEYDALGAQTAVHVGDVDADNPEDNVLLSRNTYATDRSHKLMSTEFGNGGKIENEYDDYDRLLAVEYDNDANKRYEYAYGANGQVSRVKDIEQQRSHETEYDLAGRPKRSTTRDNEGRPLYEATVKYDKYDHLTEFGERVKTGNRAWKTFETEYDYDKDDRTTRIRYKDGEHEVKYTYDSVGRVSNKVALIGSYENGEGETVDRTRTVKYEYIAGGYPNKPDKKGNITNNSTTPLVEKISQTGFTRSYVYDEVGNITEERRGTGSSRVVEYVYDQLGQLIRVNDPDDKTGGSAGTTWCYEYDMGGNIQTKKAYRRTTENPTGTPVLDDWYTYKEAWRDQLHSVTRREMADPLDLQNPQMIDVEHVIEYDDIGNPTSYNGWTYTWEKGRQLKRMDRDLVEVEYQYNAAGLRIGKTIRRYVVNKMTGLRELNYEEAIEYTLHGKLITHLKQTKTMSDNQEIIKQLHFYYDAQSRPLMVEDCSGSAPVMYSYVHNLQGDVLAILDSEENVVVEYGYDAWGRTLAVEYDVDDDAAWMLAEVNPFRYRGYVFDAETGLYYLRSRYYEPSWGRFLNADDVLGKIGGVTSHHIYLYCQNNPIRNSDQNGKSFMDWLRELVRAQYNSDMMVQEMKISAVRNVATSLSGSVTDRREWPLTQACFSHFIHGNGSPLSNSVRGDLITAMSATGVFQEAVLAGNYEGVVEFAEGDLSLSIQHMSYRAVLHEKDGVNYATIYASDTYDFTELRAPITLANIANDLGVTAQEIGLGVPYDVNLIFTLNLDEE